MTRQGAIMIAAVLLLFSVFVTSAAAAMPEYERLGAVTESLNAPAAIALDAYENLYVAEPVNNRVLIYSPGGEHIDILPGLSNPISIAVDADGRVLVGSSDRKNVEVYDAELNFLFKLGVGNGEFEKPSAIAVDADGNIYVADSDYNDINVYDPDGTYSFSFGGPSAAVPTPDGRFNYPTAITIDRARGELIVADLQLIKSWSGTYRGARVQVFSLSDLLNPAIDPKLPDRSFGEYGTGTGKMLKPKGVAVDEAGRIYVTDSAQGVAHVFDGDGASLGTIYDLAVPMRTPLGIALGRSNRLFIASLNATRVDIYGLQPYEQMQVEPLSLAFQGQEGAEAPAAQSVYITNTGTGTLNWSASTGSTWITLPEEAVPAGPAETAGLEVGVNLAGLAAGSYTAAVQVVGESGITETVQISLEVTASPELSVTPLSLEFVSINGSDPGTKSLSVQNTGTGTLNWSAESGSIWLSIDNTAGTAPDTINASPDISTLAEGTYLSSITVTAAAAAGSPVVVPVTLEIIEQKGTINVVTNLERAVFTINGAASYTGSGTLWTKTDAPAGTYAIVYAEAPGYIKPGASAQTLAPEGSITFSGLYRKEYQLTPMQSIIVGAGANRHNPGTVEIIHPDASKGVEFTAHAYNYGAQVAAGDINADGVDEIITAPGAGPGNPAEINIFDALGNRLDNLSITANQYGYGANIASADFDGDGRDEVIVGAGTGPGNPAEVKIFTYDPILQQMVDSGLELLAHDPAYGVRVAAADIDGDGTKELVTASGASGEVRMWSIDTSEAGQWSAEFEGEFIVQSRRGYSVTIAGGDINGDGIDEIITGPGPHKKARDRVEVFESDGTSILKFRARVSKRYGVEVAAGDINADGKAEIITAGGPHKNSRARIKVYDMYGRRIARYKAMKLKYGANVAAGSLGFEAAE